MSKKSVGKKKPYTVQQLAELEQNFPKKVVLAKPTKSTLSKRILIITVTMIAVLAVGWFLGTIPYYIKYAKCGTPPISVVPGLATAEPSYYKAGDKDYGPAPFRYYLCQHEIDNT